MNGGLVEVSGTRVFVDDRGTGRTALLYVHGGPGQGAHDFMASVGDSLAETFRVVGSISEGACAPTRSASSLRSPTSCSSKTSNRFGASWALRTGP